MPGTEAVSCALEPVPAGVRSASETRGDLLIGEALQPECYYRLLPLGQASDGSSNEQAVDHDLLG